MNPLLLIKNLSEPKAMSNVSGGMLDKWLKRSGTDEKTNDFGKILKQRDQQEKPSKRSENFSQSDKKLETRKEVAEREDENVRERPEREDLKDEERIFFVPDEGHQIVEDDAEDLEVNDLLGVQIPEKFSTDEVAVVEVEPTKVSTELSEQDTLVCAIDRVQTPEPVEEVSGKSREVDDSPDLATLKADLVATKEAPTSEAMADKVATEEKPQKLEVQIETLKANPKMAKSVPIAHKNEIKTQISNPQSFEGIQNSGHLLNLQHFDAWNNIGIKSAPKGDERKGGFVSSLSTVFTESEDPLHRESAISSNGSRVAEVLSQKDDIPFSKDSEQLLGGKDVVLPQVQPKVAVNTYERVQQDRLETVQGMIATLEQQMDEMKRARRNSVIVKVDLENGESLNCQVTLTRSDVAIRFPALEESFKMQLLNHWESLRKFAQTRQLNLEEPHFIAQTSL